MAIIIIMNMAIHYIVHRSIMFTKLEMKVLCFDGAAAWIE